MMLYYKRICQIIFIGIFLCTPAAISSDGQIQYHNLVKSVYDFSPRNLDHEGIEKASKKLDKFWSSQKKKKKKILPLLRIELNTDGHAPYFYYDGASLLLSLSNTPEDKNIVLQSIVKADLQDLNHTDYLRRVHALAAEGFDTTEATFHMLDYKEFYAYLPMHSLEIKRSLATVFMLQPTSEKFYLDKVITRLKYEKDDIVKNALLECLWMTVTDQGMNALKEMSQNDSQPAKIREFSAALLARDTDDNANDIKATIEELKDKRRKTLTGLNDEVLYEFYDVTREILAVYQK